MHWPATETSWVTVPIQLLVCSSCLSSEAEWLVLGYPAEWVVAQNKVSMVLNIIATFADSTRP